MDKNAITGEPFELRQLLGKYSMDTISSCAFGVDAQAFTNKDSKFVEYADNFFKQDISVGIKFALLSLPMDIGIYFETYENFF